MLMFRALLCTYAQVWGSYVRARERIDLKICMVAAKYIDTLSLKFEKDPFSSCREINVLTKVGRFF